MTTLVLADVAGAALGDVTAKALSAAKALGDPPRVLIAGPAVEREAKQAAKLKGVEKVVQAALK